MIKSIFYHFKNRVARYIAYIIFCILISLLAQSCASALTITDNLRTISDTNYNYLINVGDTSNYKDYIITSEYINNGNYNYYTTYYLCLTNNELTITDEINMSVNCDKLIKYYSYSNDYTYDISFNEELVLDNSIYYLKDKKYTNIYIFLWSISIILSINLIFHVLSRILRNRYGGLKYGKIT